MNLHELIPGPGTRLARAVTVALAVLLAGGQPASGQTADGARKRVGVLAEGRECEKVPDNLSRGLAPLLAARGFAEGRNLEFVVRCVPVGQNLAEPYARQLVAERVDALMTWGTSKTRALQRATTTIPILAGVGDPVGSGFARTLARPGGNITGLSYGTNERAQKNLELLREVVPGLAQLIILYGKSYGSESEVTAPFVAAAKAAGVSTRLHLVGSADDVAGALRSVAAPRRSAALAFNIFEVDARVIAESAVRHGIAFMPLGGDGVEAGGLLSFQLIHDNEVERTAVLLEKLLRGTPPAKIPFEFPTRSSLVVNMRTAAALKLPLPPGLLLRADRVIE